MFALLPRHPHETLGGQVVILGALIGNVDWKAETLSRDDGSGKPGRRRNGPAGLSSRALAVVKRLELVIAARQVCLHAAAAHKNFNPGMPQRTLIPPPSRHTPIHRTRRHRPGRTQAFLKCGTVSVSALLPSRGSFHEMADVNPARARHEGEATPLCMYFIAREGGHPGRQRHGQAARAPVYSVYLDVRVRCPGISVLFSHTPPLRRRVAQGWQSASRSR